MQIRKERPKDMEAVRRVHEQAFGGKAEALLVDRLRARGALAISLVALEAGRIIGHIAFSAVKIGASKARALGLAPVAVLPERQRQGAGSQLIREGIESARQLGCEVILVLGHPGYYPRFGFAPSDAYGITCKYPAPPGAFMLLELKPGALKGVKGLAEFEPDFDEAA